MRGVELGLDTLNLPKLQGKTADELRERLRECDDERLFAVYAAPKNGVSMDEVFEATKIDRLFLSKLLHLIEMERALETETLTGPLYLAAKQLGFLDSTIRRLSGQELPEHRYASYKMVDTCAAEYPAETPYFYSTFDEENEAAEFLRHKGTGRKKIMVFG